MTVISGGLATENDVRHVSETGRAIGDAWEGSGNSWGSNPE